MTRDSRWLFVVQIVAGLFGVFGATVTDPAAYGLSPVSLRWISLLGLLVSNAASKLATSPLPAKDEPFWR